MKQMLLPHCIAVTLKRENFSRLYAVHEGFWFFLPIAGRCVRNESTGLSVLFIYSIFYINMIIFEYFIWFISI